MMDDGAPAILILVDDDAAVLSAMTFAFEVEGFEVRAYADAESLLDEPQVPTTGCMVLDYKLPGINGLELLARMRERGVELPAVLITTSTASVRAKAAAAHVALIEKPLEGRLLETVKRLLEANARTAH